MVNEKKREREKKLHKGEIKKKEKKNDRKRGFDDREDN